MCQNLVKTFSPSEDMVKHFHDFTVLGRCVKSQIGVTEDSADQTRVLNTTDGRVLICPSKRVPFTPRSDHARSDGCSGALRGAAAFPFSELPLKRAEAPRRGGDGEDAPVAIHRSAEEPRSAARTARVPPPACQPAGAEARDSLRERRSFGGGREREGGGGVGGGGGVRAEEKEPVCQSYYPVWM